MAQGAADDPVDLIQPVLEDPHSHADGQGDEPDLEEVARLVPDDNDAHPGIAQDGGHPGPDVRDRQLMVECVQRRVDCHQHEQHGAEAHGRRRGEGKAAAPDLDRQRFLPGR